MERVTVVTVKSPCPLQTAQGGRQKADLAAPLVDGKANDECVRFFAKLAGVPRTRVHIVTGANSQMKVIEIEGLSPDMLDALILSPNS